MKVLEKYSAILLKIIKIGIAEVQQAIFGKWVLKNSYA